MTVKLSGDGAAWVTKGQDGNNNNNNNNNNNTNLYNAIQVIFHSALQSLC